MGIRGKLLSVVTLCLLGLAFAAIAGAGAASAAVPPTSEITSITPYYTKAHVEATVHPNVAGAEICWLFQYGEKEQIDKTVGQEEQWNYGEQGCYFADKDEPHPISFDQFGIRVSEQWYGRFFVRNGEDSTYSPYVEFETTHVNTPITTIDSITEITTNSASFTGTINPNAPKKASEMTDEEEKEAYRTNWEFRCEPGCNVYEVNGVPGNGGQLNFENSDLVSPVFFSAKANNLEPGRTYTVYMNATNQAGDYYDYLTKAGKMTFKTLPVPPEAYYLESAPVNTVRTTSARLVGLINKKNSPLTDCYFEYGTTTGYGTKLPCVERSGYQLVTADVLGLQPDTTYHFRLVAANTEGTDIGDDRTFTTLALPEPPPSCTNEAIRIEQKASVTNKCRAWELVSPTDKNGGNITLENGAASAAKTGDAITYLSRGSFADTEGAGIIGNTEYVARRGPSGWETHSMLPTPATETAQTGFFPGNTVVEQFSDDMRTGILGAYDLPRMSDDIETGENMFLLETETRKTETITKRLPEEESGFLRKLEYQFLIFRSGANADMSLVSFPSRTPLLPEAPEGGFGKESLYEWEDGELRLASYLPNGQPATNGVQPSRTGFTSTESMSRDGSLVTFLAKMEENGPEQLLARRNHTDTVWVSEPEGTIKTAPEQIKLEHITLDNKHILFTTISPLLDEDTNGNYDLYMYTDSPHPESEENLQLVSTGTTEDPGGGEHGGGGVIPNGEALIGASDDGSYIYYQDNKYNIGQIILYKNGQRRVVFFPYGNDEPRGLTVDPGSMRVSRDGRRLVMITRAGPEALYGGNYGLNGILTKNKLELWVYDDPSETTICASCPDYPAGTEEKAPKADTVIEPEVLKGINIQFTLLNRPRYMTEDGKLAFFATPEALVPQDINGIMDVYEYDIETGHLHLVSSGKGEWGTWFVDASANGDDVFIGTREKLINADKDTLADIYDARIQGGYPEPPPAPTACVGDACRGPIPVAPNDVTPSTPRFAGPGDPAPKHAKKKKKHKRNTKKAKKRGKKVKRGHKRAHREHGGSK